MEVKNEISQELMSLSTVVAAISRQTPYEVPGGYFTTFPTRALRRIGEWRESKSLKFSVPEGYFEGFAKGVLDRIKAGDIPDTAPDVSLRPGVDEELAGISPVLAEAGLLAGTGRITPYELPEGYFQEISPILFLIKGKNPYTVPQGYFEILTAETIARTVEPVTERESVTRVVPMTGRASRKMSWWKYAAAAVVIGLILTGGWLRFHNPGSHSNQQGTGIDIAGNLSKVSDQELQSFLADQDTTLAQPIMSSTATLNMDDSDLKTLLGEVPDGELKQYMEEHGGANDIATN
jgi:hypothetical protein